MTKWYTYISVYIICAAIGCFSVTVEAKKRCKPLLEKLQNVQALQRNGYSLKKGQSLRAREDKARDNWWQCERSSSFKSAKKSKGGSNKARKKSSKTKKTQKAKTKLANKGVKSVAAPFASNQRIDIKSKYPRKKHFAWLDFYQQPQRCHKPKSLTTFAFCSEDKLAQQANFERQYVKPIEINTQSK